jgi:hypothetical protein
MYNPNTTNPRGGHRTINRLSELAPAMRALESFPEVSVDFSGPPPTRVHRIIAGLLFSTSEFRSTLYVDLLALLSEALGIAFDLGSLARHVAANGPFTHDSLAPLATFLTRQSVVKIAHNSRGVSQALTHIIGVRVTPLLDIGIYANICGVNGDPVFQPAAHRVQRIPSVAKICDSLGIIFFSTVDASLAIKLALDVLSATMKRGLLYAIATTSRYIDLQEQFIVTDLDEIHRRFIPVAALMDPQPSWQRCRNCKVLNPPDFVANQLQLCPICSARNTMCEVYRRGRCHKHNCDFRHDPSCVFPGVPLVVPPPDEVIADLTTSLIETRGCTNVKCPAPVLAPLPPRTPQDPQGVTLLPTAAAASSAASSAGKNASASSEGIPIKTDSPAAGDSPPSSKMNAITIAESETRPQERAADGEAAVQSKLVVPDAGNAPAARASETAVPPSVKKEEAEAEEAWACVAKPAIEAKDEPARPSQDSSASVAPTPGAASDETLNPRVTADKSDPVTPADSDAQKEERTASKPGLRVTAASFVPAATAAPFVPSSSGVSINLAAPAAEISKVNAPALLTPRPLAASGVSTTTTTAATNSVGGAASSSVPPSSPQPSKRREVSPLTSKITTHTFTPPNPMVEFCKTGLHNMMLDPDEILIAAQGRPLVRSAGDVSRVIGERLAGGMGRAMFIPPAVEPCRNYFSPRGCREGLRCGMSHQSIPLFVPVPIMIDDAAIDLNKGLMFVPCPRQFIYGYCNLEHNGCQYLHLPPGPLPQLPLPAMLSPSLFPTPSMSIFSTKFPAHTLDDPQREMPMSGPPNAAAVASANAAIMRFRTNASRRAAKVQDPPPVPQQKQVARSGDGSPIQTAADSDQQKPRLDVSTPAGSSPNRRESSDPNTQTKKDSDAAAPVQLQSSQQGGHAGAKEQAGGEDGSFHREPVVETE